MRFFFDFILVFPMTLHLRSGRYFHDSISRLLGTSVQLSLRPETSSMYNLKLFPLSIERSAILAQYENEERYANECVQTAYEEERDRVEEEWKKGRDRVRERLLEGIEERRRKAREEKEGEGATGGQYFATLIKCSHLDNAVLYRCLT